MVILLDRVSAYREPRDIGIRALLLTPPDHLIRTVPRRGSIEPTVSGGNLFEVPTVGLEGATLRQEGKLR